MSPWRALKYPKGMHTSIWEPLTFTVYTWSSQFAIFSSLVIVFRKTKVQLFQSTVYLYCTYELPYNGVCGLTPDIVSSRSITVSQVIVAYFETVRVMIQINLV